MKVGDIRYTASIWDGKIEFEEWFLRTIQKRKKFAGINWREPVRVCYWVQKIKGITWVKLSKSHGDWGFVKNVPELFRRSNIFGKDPVGRPTKIGALKVLRADVNRCLKAYGPGPDPDFPDEEPFDVQLAKIDRAIKRMKKST